ncbi:unnamed protein product [Rhizoctonia solani]|uniref:F-box domain-containing protein n=1 Tax=Rhizoctonia solani TaxID=456999 RepID=A0A8H3HRI4_9AGAM|nr:unnamed protein product [Rhizoctonia solani]
MRSRIVHPIASTRLPIDILLCILHHCDFSTIIQFSMTSKKSQSMVHQTTSLQLCIELDVNGLEIVKQSLKPGVTYAVILEELKDYRDAWLSFSFGPRLSLQQPATNSVLSHRSGQCHGEAYFKPFRVPEVGEDTNQRYPFNRIRLTDFRSPTNSDLPLDFKRSFRNFIADAKQDLIVLIDHEDVSFTQVDIHLNHISTAEAHSLARSPTLTVRFEELDEEPDFHYGGAWIMGHILVVRFTPASRKNRRICDNIAIWDWQSGLFLGRIISETNSIKPTFIDKNTLLFLAHTSELSSSSEPAQNQVALLVYHIPTALAVSAQEPQIADCYMPSCPSLRPTLIFELPRLDPNYRVLRPIFWDTLAGPGDLACQRSAQVVHSCVKTVALSLCVANKHPSNSESEHISPIRYSIFLSTDSILDHLSKNRSEDTVTIDWSDWGTTATRWFMDRNWLSDTAKIHGSTHLVTCYNLIKNGVLVTSYIREFNPQIIKRHTSNVLDQDEREKVLQGEGFCVDPTDPIRIVGNDTKTVVCIGFEQPVESTLPYMIVYRERSTLPSTGWYIHSDYLVERSGGSHLSLYQLKF